MTKPTCSMPECERVVIAKGICALHYRRSRPECVIDGCTQPQRNTTPGWCNTHMLRQEKHGSPHVTMKGKTHKVQYTDDGLRVCKVCGEAKPETEYHRDKYGTNGYRSLCKACARARQAAKYAVDPERYKAERRSFRIENRDRLRVYGADRYLRERERRIEYATANGHIRRARLKNGEHEAGITHRSLRAIHGDHCAYCEAVMDFQRGKRGKINPLRATIEHIIPLSQGGGHTWENTTLACHRCNVTKNAKTVEQFEQWREGIPDPNEKLGSQVS